VATEGDAWDALQGRIDALLKGVGAVAAVAVNSSSLRSETKETVQHYFRTARPWIINAGLPEQELDALDNAFQELNVLALGNNRKSSYLGILRGLRQRIAAFGMRRDMLFGKGKVRSGGSATTQQETIINTLAKMLPAAGESFKQVIADLNDSSRASFRGTAAELREVLREVVDHLAPDHAVMGAQGFQLERGRDGPTMRQKVRFVMKSRGRGSSAATTEDALAGADALVRSLYNRGSAAAHSAKEKAEVLKIRGYTEAILVDLLEIE
jgi:hypothetical protein